MLVGIVILGTPRHLPAVRNWWPRCPRRTCGHRGRDRPGARGRTVASRRSCRSTLAARRHGRPTPVSAYLHAAAMVKAGVYPDRPAGPVLPTPRLAPTVITSAWPPCCWPAGAVREYDLKLILAFGTVSQLRPSPSWSAAAAGHDAGRAGHAVSRTRCSRPRCSWWSASSTTPPAPATSAGWPGWAAAAGLFVIAAAATASMAALPPFRASSPRSRLRGDRAQRLAGLLAPVVLAGVVTGRCSPRSTACDSCGGVRAQGFSQSDHPGDQPAPPEGHFPGRPAILAAAGLLFGLAPGRLDDTLTTTPRPMPPPVPPATTR